MATDESLVAADLLAILRCPQCHGVLTPTEASLGCAVCRIAFSVHDGVPNFLLEDAVPFAAASDPSKSPGPEKSSGKKPPKKSGKA